MLLARVVFPTWRGPPRKTIFLLKSCLIWDVRYLSTVLLYIIFLPLSNLLASIFDPGRIRQPPRLLFLIVYHNHRRFAEADGAVDAQGNFVRPRIEPDTVLRRVTLHVICRYFFFFKPQIPGVLHLKLHVFGRQVYLDAFTGGKLSHCPVTEDKTINIVQRYGTFDNLLGRFVFDGLDDPHRPLPGVIMFHDSLFFAEYVQVTFHLLGQECPWVDVDLFFVEKFQSLAGKGEQKRASSIEGHQAVERQAGLPDAHFQLFDVVLDRFAGTKRQYSRRND